MHIAICDDSKIDAKRIEWALMDISDELDFSYYPSGKDLLEAISEGAHIDVVYLDVYMPGEYGLDIADQLKEISPDTNIIFSTSSTEHALDAFKVHAIDYLVKPVKEIDIVRSFAKVRMAPGSRMGGAIVLVRTSGEILAYNPRNVLRIESDKHYTHIISTNGNTDIVHMNFSDVVAKFREGFLVIKRGICVRMDQIVRISGDEVFMTDSTSFRLSRANKAELIRRYVDYIEGDSEDRNKGDN